MKKIYYPMFSTTDKGKICPVYSVTYDDYGRAVEVTVWDKDDLVTLEKGEFELLTGRRCYPREGFKFIEEDNKGI